MAMVDKDTVFPNTDPEGKGKNSTGNGEAEELICTTHGHELRREGNMGEGGGCRAEGNKGVGNGATVIA